METYYHLLGVNEQAPPRLIRAAYLDLMRQVHPDCAPGCELIEAANLNVAYSVLRDADRRADYDARLARSRIPKHRFPAPPTGKRSSRLLVEVLLAGSVVLVGWAIVSSDQIRPYFVPVNAGLGEVASSSASPDTKPGGQAKSEISFLRPSDFGDRRREDSRESVYGGDQPDSRCLANPALGGSCQRAELVEAEPEFDDPLISVFDDDGAFVTENAAQRAKREGRCALKAPRIGRHPSGSRSDEPFHAC